MISSIHDNTMSEIEVTRNKKIKVPEMVLKYWKGMRGVDIMDQYIQECIYIS